MPMLFPPGETEYEGLEGLTDEERKRLMEAYAPPAVSTGPVTRGVQDFAPLSGSVAPSVLMPDREGLARREAPASPEAVDADFMRRFAEAQGLGARRDTLNALGHGFGADAALISGSGVNTIARDAGRRTQPVADLMAARGVEQQGRQAARQARLDTVNLAKTEAETAKAQASAQATQEEAAREAALARVDSPETEAQRKSTAALLAKNPHVTAELLTSLNGLQLRELARTGTSQINAEVMAGFRQQQLEQQGEQAEREARLRAWALQQGWDIAKLTLDQRDRLAQKEAELRAAQTAKETTNKNIEIESSLRREFQALPEVKELPAIEASYRVLQSSAKDMSGLGATATVFNIMKMLDPGVAVMEGDVRLIRGAGGPAARFANLYEEVLSGNPLPASVRADIMKQAEVILASKRKAVEEAAQKYRALAADVGVDAKRVVLSGPERAPMPGGELRPPPGIKSSTMPSRSKPATPAAKPKPPPLDPTKTVKSQAFSKDGKWVKETYTDGTWGTGPAEKARKVK